MTINFNHILQSVSIRVTRMENKNVAYIVSDPISNKKLRLTKGAFQKFVTAIKKGCENLDPVEDEICKILYDEIFRNRNISSEQSEKYRQWSSRGWGRSLEFFLNSRKFSFSDSFVDYKQAQSEAVLEYSDKTKLPTPKLVGELVSSDSNFISPTVEYFGDVLLKRKCSERPRAGKCDKKTLSSILFYSTLRFRDTWNPSKDDANSIYSSLGSCFDFYIANYSCDGLLKKVYIYHPDINRLEETGLLVSRNDAYDLLIGHDAPLSASFTIFMVANYDRAMWRYRHDRALRNLYVEAGRICQYFLLVLTSYKILTHITPAAVDDLATNLLSLDVKKQQLIYSISAS